MKKPSFKSLSIRGQLTLWYSLIIIGVTIVLFLSFYFLTRKYLAYETDRSLTIHAIQLANNIAQSTTDVHNGQITNILDLSQKEVPGIFIEIVDLNGLNTKGAVSNFVNIATQAVNQNSPSFTEQKIGDMTMRVIVYPIKTSENIIGSVVMGHPIDVYQSTLAQLRNVGILILFFLITPSIFVGYLLGKSVTDPITKLGADINKITSENLANRIDIPARSKETAVLVNNFNSLLDRLSKAFNLERQFLGELAHEIKTPLTVIKSNTEVTLARTRSAREYQDAIKQIQSQIDKLSNSMASLMDFAWSQSTDLLNTFKRVDLLQLMLEIVNIADYMALPKKIHVNSNLEKSVFVMGKEEKLYQAIFNIVDNAIKFTPERGRIDLRLYKEKDRAVIKISDTGIGIEEEKLKDIFNRFYRTEQNKNIAGHGLGLAITDSIIKAHAGTVRVESKQGEGSIITVMLDLAH